MGHRERRRFAVEGAMNRTCRSGVIMALLAVALLFGMIAPISATASPAAIARHILGHKPRGLAATVVARGYMRSATDANYRPQSSIDPSNGKPVGFDIDVARRAAEILGLRVRFRFPLWQTIPASLTAHRYYDVSIGSMDITRARRVLVDFAEPYRYTAAQTVVKMGGRQISDVSDLFGRRVGVERSSVYAEFLRRYSTIKVRTYATSTDALQDLRHGKIGFVLMGREDARQAIRVYHVPVRFSGRPLFHAKLAFAVGMHQRDWLVMLDFAVSQMHREGSLSALSRKWYGGRDLTHWQWGR
jgi:ABC-type amino acid transport substrate-binding protein